MRRARRRKIGLREGILGGIVALGVLSGGTPNFGWAKGGGLPEALPPELEKEVGAYTLLLFPQLLPEAEASPLSSPLETHVPDEAVSPSSEPFLWSLVNGNVFTQYMAAKLLLDRAWESLQIDPESFLKNRSSEQLREFLFTQDFRHLTTGLGPDVETHPELLVTYLQVAARQLYQKDWERFVSEYLGYRLRQLKQIEGQRQYQKENFNALQRGGLHAMAHFNHVMQQLVIPLFATLAARGSFLQGSIRVAYQRWKLGYSIEGNTLNLVAGKSFWPSGRVPSSSPRSTAAARQPNQAMGTIPRGMVDARSNLQVLKPTADGFTVAPEIWAMGVPSDSAPGRLLVPSDPDIWLRASAGRDSELRSSSRRGSEGGSLRFLVPRFPDGDSPAIPPRQAEQVVHFLQHEKVRTHGDQILGSLSRVANKFEVSSPSQAKVRDFLWRMKNGDFAQEAMEAKLQKDFTLSEIGFLLHTTFSALPRGQGVPPVLEETSVLQTFPGVWDRWSDLASLEQWLEQDFVHVTETTATEVAFVLSDFLTELNDELYRLHRDEGFLLDSARWSDFAKAYIHRELPHLALIAIDFGDRVEMAEINQVTGTVVGDFEYREGDLVRYQSLPGRFEGANSYEQIQEDAWLTSQSFVARWRERLFLAGEPKPLSLEELSARVLGHNFSQPREAIQANLRSASLSRFEIPQKFPPGKEDTWEAIPIQQFDLDSLTPVLSRVDRDSYMEGLEDAKFLYVEHIYPLRRLLLSRYVEKTTPGISFDPDQPWMASHVSEAVRSTLDGRENQFTGGYNLMQIDEVPEVARMKTQTGITLDEASGNLRILIKSEIQDLQDPSQKVQLPVQEVQIPWS